VVDHRRRALRRPARRRAQHRRPRGGPRGPAPHRDRGRCPRRGHRQEGLRFVDEDGAEVAAFPAEPGDTGGPTAEAEILRGELARILYERTADRTEYVFGDEITGLESHDDGVDVIFRRGAARSFDVVVIAEGLTSHTPRAGHARRPDPRSRALHGLPDDPPPSRRRPVLALVQRALVGAYVLAGELAAHGADRVDEAFAAYDARLRPYVERAQRIAPGAPGLAHPRTRAGITVFRRAAALVGSRPGRALTGVLGRLGSTPAADIELPDLRAAAPPGRTAA
jgi:2-polyprenyl-6-methoxyphenol hydroxylase-like FAD-dependent oxidoreductase